MTRNVNDIKQKVELEKWNRVSKNKEFNADFKTVNKIQKMSPKNSYYFSKREGQKEFLVNFNNRSSN
jgi:hypothetical protein